MIFIWFVDGRKPTTIFEFSSHEYWQGKTRLCNKMEDDFLIDFLILYIERDIVVKNYYMINYRQFLGFKTKSSSIGDWLRNSYFVFFFLSFIY